MMDWKKKSLTSNQNKIRYIWAFLTALQTVLAVIISIQGMMGSNIEQNIYLPLFTALPLLVIQYSIFHFIFLKHGTKLLMFLMFWMPISFITSFVTAYHSDAITTLWILSWSITGVWYGLFWQMRKINLQINTQKI